MYIWNIRKEDRTANEYSSDDIAKDDEYLFIIWKYIESFDD